MLLLPPLGIFVCVFIQAATYKVACRAEEFGRRCSDAVTRRHNVRLHSSDDTGAVCS